MADVEFLLEAILDELKDMNSKLDDIRGFGINGNSLADVCEKLDEAKGVGIHGDTLADVCDRIEDVCFKLDMMS